ncbi:hypothetical protein SEA_LITTLEMUNCHKIN_57 [Gordonia phage LittleMunchkin]|nr:hypothetical protein SEA_LITTLEMUNCHKIN_57 [Gordonia phage LittleMunchkin]
MKDHTRRPEVIPAFRETYTLGREPETITVEVQVRPVAQMVGPGYRLAARAVVDGREWHMGSSLSGTKGRFILSAAATQLARQLDAQVRFDLAEEASR